MNTIRILNIILIVAVLSMVYLNSKLRRQNAEFLNIAENGKTIAHESMSATAKWEHAWREMKAANEKQYQETVKAQQLTRETIGLVELYRSKWQECIETKIAAGVRRPANDGDKPFPDHQPH